MHIMRILIALNIKVNCRKFRLIELLQSAVYYIIREHSVNLTVEIRKNL